MLKVKVFEGSFSSFITAIRKRGYCQIEDIVKLISMLSDLEMDCSCGICGQNGSGKTYLGLMILKAAMKEKWKENLILADKTSSDVVQYLLTHKHSFMLIDEANLYLGYKDHATLEQKHLLNMIELSRSKEIGILACIRDPRKFTLNFRDGKLSVILWMMDRYADRSGAYAAVLVAPMNVESEDRFGLQNLEWSIPSYKAVRSEMEALPSFIGWLKVPAISKYLTSAEVSEYKQFKEKAMASAHLNYCLRMAKKGKMDPSELAEQIDNLRPILGEIILPEPPQKRLFDES